MRRQHLGSRPHVCLICSEQFEVKEDLKKHQLKCLNTVTVDVLEIRATHRSSAPSTPRQSIAVPEKRKVSMPSPPSQPSFDPPPLITPALQFTVAGRPSQGLPQQRDRAPSALSARSSVPLTETKLKGMTTHHDTMQKGRADWLRKPSSSAMESVDPGAETVNATFPFCIDCSRIFLDISELDRHVGRHPTHRAVRGTWGEQDGKQLAPEMRKSPVAYKRKKAARSWEFQDDSESDLCHRDEKRAEVNTRSRKTPGSAEKKATTGGALLPVTEKSEELVEPIEDLRPEARERKPSGESNATVICKTADVSRQVSPTEGNCKTKQQEQGTEGCRQVISSSEKRREEDELRQEALEQLAMLRHQEEAKRNAAEKEAEEKKRVLASKARAREKSYQDSLQLFQTLDLSDEESDSDFSHETVIPVKKTISPMVAAAAETKKDNKAGNVTPDAPNPHAQNIQLPATEPMVDRSPAASPKVSHSASEPVINGQMRSRPASVMPVFTPGVPFKDLSAVHPGASAGAVQPNQFVPLARAALPQDPQNPRCSQHPQHSQYPQYAQSVLPARAALPHDEIQGQSKFEVPSRATSPQVGLNVRSKPGVPSTAVPPQASLFGRFPLYGETLVMPGAGFNCWLCLNGGQSFQAEEALNNHIREQHTAQKDDDCPAAEPQQVSQRLYDQIHAPKSSIQPQTSQTANSVQETIYGGYKMSAEEFRRGFKPAVPAPRWPDGLQPPILPFGPPIIPTGGPPIIPTGGPLITPAGGPQRLWSQIRPTDDSHRSRQPSVQTLSSIRYTSDGSQPNLAPYIPNDAPAGTFVPFPSRGEGQSVEPARNHLHGFDLYTAQQRLKRRRTVGSTETEEFSLAARETTQAPSPVRRDESGTPRAQPISRAGIFDQLLKIEGGPWETICYLSNTWSIMKDKAYADYIYPFLDPLCHTTAELEDAGFTLAPWGEEEFKLMQKCYQCRSKSPPPPPPPTTHNY